MKMELEKQLKMLSNKKDTEKQKKYEIHTSKKDTAQVITSFVSQLESKLNKS